MSLFRCIPFLAVCAAGAVFAGDSLQEALAANAVAIRSIDPAGEDFDDLTPLIESIGSARLVLLGEPGHGSGGAFAAKARLIRFLHRSMGFDVVAWESGLHGVAGTQAGLAGADPVAAARAGILAIWSAAEEVRSLFEYARSTLGSQRPLEMAGFDLQFSAPGASARFASDLREFLAATHDRALRTRALALAEEMLSASDRLRAPPRPPATAASVSASDLESVTRASDALLGLLREQRVALLRAHSELRIGFMEHAIANLRGDSLNTYARRRSDRPKDAGQIPLRSEEWNRRAARMVANLRWLLEERYRGRKLIVWAHNAHIVQAYFAADWAAVAHEPLAGGMNPMGASLRRWLPDDVFAIGFTAYDGDENWTNGQKRGSIAPAPAGSLEARLHEIGKPYAFVDLRAVSRRLSGAPVGPLSMRISGFGKPTWPYGNDVVPDLARAFDGVFFIDRMTPATTAKVSQAAPE